MDMVLIAGLWLDATAWDAVVPSLKEAGHNPVPVLLPGQGDGSTTETLDDQVAAVTSAIDSLPGPVLVIGHSAACTLAWIAADVRAEKTVKVAMIGGFPSAEGETYADLFEYKDGVMPFPGWSQFEGPDSRDLDEPTKNRMAAASIPVPQGVAQGVIHLTDPRRYELPVVIVCPEFSIDEAREWIAAGVPELKQARDVSYLNIDSGHWPMFTRPAELAKLLCGLADVAPADFTPAPGTTAGDDG
jgi:pimeloyl-ACP methyl ester carboxylesterase